MAEEARRQGWRVVAFAFEGAADLVREADRVVPSRIGALGPVIEALGAEGVRAVAFAGRFSMPALLRTDRGDEAHARMAAAAGSLVDANLSAVLDTTLASLGVELLDQRRFLGAWLAAAGCHTSRTPSEREWEDVRRGLEVARLAADASVGQTVVVKRGAVSAVEAVEGTTETIRRGTALAGAGAVVVKAAARRHDFRFDVPTIGPETVAAAAAGGAAVVAVEAGRVLILDREATAAAAERAGIALVSVDADGV
jgi:hypothetical protein